MRSLTFLACGGDFASIGGLQYATNLVTLDLAYGEISGPLTLPNTWTKLRTLELWGNQITQLTVPNTLTSLTKIDVSSNYLTTFNLPTNLSQIRDIHVSNNGIGSLHQLSSLPAETHVFAFDQTVRLPAVTVGHSYSLISRKRDGSNTSLTLPAGVTRTSSGLVYSKAGTYTISFDGTDTQNYTTSFDGRFVQTASDPVVYPKGDHTGDRIADLYAVDPAGALQFIKGSHNTNFTPAGQRGSSWQGMTHLTQVADMSDDGWSDLISRRGGDNSLWLYRAGANGYISGSKQIGWNWGGMDAIIPVGNLGGGSTQYVVARQSGTGKLFRYILTPAGLSGVTQIGQNWQGMRQFIGIGDFTGDGRADLLAIRTDGTLWAYAGTSNATIGAATQVGRGWGNFRQAFSPGDISGDGRPDLMGQSGDGTLYVYNNNLGSWSAARKVMTGTLGYRLIA